MRAPLLATAIALGGCGPAPWVAPPPHGDERPADGVLRVWRRAAEEREAQFRDALDPGATARERRVRLGRGGLDDFRAEGERLFGLDAPWDGGDAPAPARPIHAPGGAPVPDATRCAGCHHVGGEGGSGGFGDLAFFAADDDADGDDVLRARRRLPPMLAGAALLERAAADHPDRSPFGWTGGRPRTLREMVRWSIDTHLATRATDEEIDAITTYVALLPPPAPEAPPRDSLVARAAHGAELFERIGCASCHVERLPVADPILRLAGGRRIDLRWRLSPTGTPPFEVAAYTDLRPHRVSARGDAEPVVTPPLWGVASRGPFLSDGRAATRQEAVLLHDGEAARARDAYVALAADQTDVQLFLETLGRAPVMTWLR